MANDIIVSLVVELTAQKECLLAACKVFATLDETAKTPEQLNEQWRYASNLAKAAIRRAESQ